MELKKILLKIAEVFFLRKHLCPVDDVPSNNRLGVISRVRHEKNPNFMRKEYDQRHFNRLQSKSRIFGLPDLIPNLQLAHGFLRWELAWHLPRKHHVRKTERRRSEQAREGAFKIHTWNIASKVGLQKCSARFAARTRAGQAMSGVGAEGATVTARTPPLRGSGPAGPTSSHVKIPSTTLRCRAGWNQRGVRCTRCNGAQIQMFCSRELVRGHARGLPRPTSFDECELPL